MKRACKRKKEQGTHETKTEKIKKEQKRRRVVKSTTGSRRLITHVSVQLFHRPSTPVQQRRAVRNSTAPVLLPRSARVDLFALTVEYMSELEVGMVRFCSEVPPCAAAHYEGIPEDCQRCVLASFCAFAKVSFSSLLQYRQSFPENVAGLPGHVHAVTSEAPKVLL